MGNITQNGSLTMPGESLLFTASPILTDWTSCPGYVFSSMNYLEVTRHILGLGLDPKQLSFIQISLRGIIVFIVSLVIVRLGDKRFLSKMSAFDAILGFILASMLARAVNGSASFFPTLGAGFVLVSLHRLIATLSFRWDFFGLLAKGRADVLVEDGKADPRKMRANKISEDDLLEEARLNGQVTEINRIRRATMERNGQVSIVPFEPVH
jgi:uncharacterized membrane protein YcaP (DUF421 family)